MIDDRIFLRRNLLIFLTVTIMSLLFLNACQVKSLVEVESRKTLIMSPHTKCIECHKIDEPRKGKSLFPAGVDPSSICLDCHDYQENHHPVNMVPTSTYYVDCGASPLPLINNQLKCLTCHEAHGGPGLSSTLNLVRGGPYPDRITICFTCHFKEKYAEIFVHNMLDSKGEIVNFEGEPVCLLCHSIQPDPAIDRTEDVRFRADVGFLCWRCHPPMPGEFFRNHFLVKPSRKVSRTMRTSEKEKDVILPLIPRNRITCSTCHNPHQRGIMVRNAAKAGTASPKRLRMPATDLCIACHDLK